MKQNQKQKKDNTLKFILITVGALLVFYIIYAQFFDRSSTTKTPPYVVKDEREQIKNIPEPQFKKEGMLQFFDSTGKKLKREIEIEIADNPAERQQGLMYRKSMPDTRGMLFTFPVEEPQGFWMKNTVIPLDIIFVDKSKKIVKIHKNTTPFSEANLPSEKPAMYVVEVIAGYADKYGITTGDKINFTYN